MLGMLAGCEAVSSMFASASAGGDDETAEVDATDADDEPDETQASAYEGSVPYLLRFREPDFGTWGLRCDSTGSTRAHCGLVVKGDKLHLAGPVGTQIRLGDEEFTLDEAQATDEKARRDLFDRKLRSIDSAETHLELPFPGPEILNGDLAGLCTKRGVARALDVDVRLPGLDAPLEMVESNDFEEERTEANMTIGWQTLRKSLDRELAAALESEDPLPALSDDADTVIYRGQCYGKDANGLKDLRYVVRVLGSSDDESLHREKACGEYRSEGNASTDVTREMWDERVEIWDRRTQKIAAKKTFRAKTPRCPSSVAGVGMDVTSYADPVAINKWIEGELTRRVGEPIVPE